MGYADKLQKLCVLRNIDQSDLASKVGLSKSSISRILSGVQEPKLGLALDLAKALGVTLDYLVEESAEVGSSQHLVTVTEEELMILKIVRRLGTNIAIDRLLSVPATGSEGWGTTTVRGGGARPDPLRFDDSSEESTDS